MILSAVSKEKYPEPLYCCFIIRQFFKNLERQICNSLRNRPCKLVLDHFKRFSGIMKGLEMIWKLGNKINKIRKQESISWTWGVSGSISWRNRLYENILAAYLKCLRDQNIPSIFLSIRAVARNFRGKATLSNFRGRLGKFLGEGHSFDKKTSATTSRGFIFFKQKI